MNAFAFKVLFFLFFSPKNLLKAWVINYDKIWDFIMKKEHDLSDGSPSETNEQIENTLPEIDLEIPNGDEIEVLQFIIDKILEESSEGNLENVFAYLEIIETIVAKNPANLDLFFLHLEALEQAIKHFSGEYRDYELLFLLIDELFDLLEANLSAKERLPTIFEVIFQAVQKIRSLALLDSMEQYINRLLKLAMDHPQNFPLRRGVAEVVIEAIVAFGEDWNYEKTKRFSQLLRKLLPREKLIHDLLGVLIKGLAQEINWYGDMHELSSMISSLELMKELPVENLPITDEGIIYYAQGLAYAMNWFGASEHFEDMTQTLHDLQVFIDFYEKTVDESLELSRPSPAEKQPLSPQSLGAIESAQLEILSELKIIYAQALRDALDRSADMSDLDAATNYAKELLELADEWPTNKTIQSIAIIGLFKAAAWAGNYWETGLMISLISRVGKIFHRFPDDKDIKILLGRGLFNLTNVLCKIGRPRVIERIVDEIALLSESNPELEDLSRFYSKALVNVILCLGEGEETIDRLIDYLEEAENLVNLYPDNSAIAISYSMAIVNAVRSFGRYGEIASMEELLEMLKDYVQYSKDPEIQLRLGKAYVDAITAYGEMNELAKIIPLIIELESWVKEDPTDIEFQIVFAEGLVNTISSFGKNTKFSEMKHYLIELEALSKKFAQVNSIQLCLSKGIAIAIRWLCSEEDLDQLTRLLSKLRVKTKGFPEEDEIQILFARSLRRILPVVAEQQEDKLLAVLFEELRLQVKQYSELEDIQTELGRALFNLLVNYRSDLPPSEWEEYSLEFRGLCIQFPENEKLLALKKTIQPIFD